MSSMEGRMACLVRQGGAVAEDGEAELEVCEEGVSVLESLGETAVTVVACAGMYRTGKSFFLNRVAGTCKSRFGVGETTEPCTRGVWIWAPEAPLASDGSRLVLMDTEGLCSPDQSETFDAKIFALGLLLSSYFVLNVVGVIDDATIERLHLVAEVGKRVVVAGGSARVSEDEEDDVEQSGANGRAAEAALARHFPPLLVLVRDFALRPTRDGVEISDAEYLEDALRARGLEGKRHRARDATRESLRTLFPTRSCATLVRPCADEADLRRASELDDSELRPEFADKFRRLRAAILGTGGDSFEGETNKLQSSGPEPRAVGVPAVVVPAARRKTVCGAVCSAAALASLARTHVGALNAGAAPSIKGAWDAAAEEVSGRALDAAKAAARDAVDTELDLGRNTTTTDGDSDGSDCAKVDDAAMRTAAARFDDRAGFEKFYRDRVVKPANAVFDARAVDGHPAKARGKKKLRTHLEDFREDLYRRLVDASTQASRKALDTAVKSTATSTTTCNDDDDSDDARFLFLDEQTAAAVGTAIQDECPLGRPDGLLAEIQGPEKGDFLRRQVVGDASILNALVAGPAARAAARVFERRAEDARNEATRIADALRADLETTRGRLDTTERRLDATTERADSIDADNRALRADLDAERAALLAAERDLDQTTRRVAFLETTLDAEKAARASDLASLAERAQTELDALAADKADAVAALEAAADEAEAAHSLDLVRLAEEANAAALDAKKDADARREDDLRRAADEHSSDLVRNIAAAAALSRCVAVVETLNKRDADVRRHTLDKDRAVKTATDALLAQHSPSGVAQHFATIGSFFSKGQKKVESVAKSLIERIDDELNDEDD